MYIQYTVYTRLAIDTYTYLCIPSEVNQQFYAKSTSISNSSFSFSTNSYSKVHNYILLFCTVLFVREAKFGKLMTELVSRWRWPPISSGLVNPAKPAAAPAGPRTSCLKSLKSFRIEISRDDELQIIQNYSHFCCTRRKKDYS